jgi:DNA-binding response OmpR family regulator
MRVLVVEDEPKIAAFIQRGLQEEHYAVDVVADGEEALDCAATTG